MKRNYQAQANLTLKQYISQQKELIKLDYELETKEKQKTEISCIDLCFISRSKNSTRKSRKWTTTLPLPKNLIAPEYLIVSDPTYVNVSDKMTVEFINCEKEPIEGKVEKIRDGELTAVFELEWEEETARHKCSIKFSPNDTVYNRKMGALKNLKHLNKSLKDMLCRRYPEEQIIPKIKLNLPLGYNFNESQKRAVRMAVSNPFSLIQGPPGTGKTHTIGAISIQALRNEPDKKVLICGTTNVSINSLLEIVGDMVQGEGFKVCWPAASSRDFLNEDNLTKEQKLMTLYKCSHMNTSDSRRFRELKNKREPTEQETREMKILREKLEEEIIKESNVIFSTLDSSGKKSIVQNIGKISTLIVDEATLSVESSMIIPLSLCPDRLVLVGDHKQLGPQASFNELKDRGYYCSMFERIIRERSCLKNSVMLNTQYRMHPDISRLPNHLFYDDELLDGVKNEERRISSKFIFDKHLNFINLNGKEEKNGTSYINTDEINQVVKFVNALVSSGVEPSQIGIISAYGAQTHLISEHFRAFGPQVKVSTIDSFQGSQKDYIIICTTRNGTDLGFLKDKRRMNVSITRARRMVSIFGNESTLAQSDFWKNVIDHTKKCKSFYERLPQSIEKQKMRSLVISKSSNNTVQELVSEFKEEQEDAGYNLREIETTISEDTVRMLWPDEEEDITFVSSWVQKRVDILNDNKNVTLAYDAESVCMQFGDIFKKEVDYYNWEASDCDGRIPEIKTKESIIISFYEHKGKHNLNPILVNTMKPLLEHPNVTFITFDFTFDFDRLYDFGINLKTERIIDVQLMILPDNSGLHENKDYVCSTGWRSIGEFINQAIEDNDNSNLILRAKENVKKGKKKFPHEENNFLITHFNYPQICQFTQIFLEYSACDIFYTAIAGVDVLSRGELEDVKERSSSKFKTYIEYREEYEHVQCVRQAYYVRESFTSAIQAQFSKENETYQILSYYKKLKSFVQLLDECPKLVQDIIPLFTEEDESNIRERYQNIVDIMEDPKNVHLGNIKDKSILSYVKGIQKRGAFVLRVKEEVDEVQEKIEEENKIIKEKFEEERKAVYEITGGKNSFKPKSKCTAWSTVDISKPMTINKVDEKFTHPPQINNQKRTNEKKKMNQTTSTKIGKPVNQSWLSLDLTNPAKTANAKNHQTNLKKQAYKPNNSILNHRPNYQQSRHVSNASGNTSSTKSQKPFRNQTTKQETPKIIGKAVNSAWTTFSKTQENKSQIKIQPPPPPPSSPSPPKDAKDCKDDKLISTQAMPSFKPKRINSSDINGHSQVL